MEPLHFTASDRHSASWLFGPRRPAKELCSYHLGIFCVFFSDPAFPAPRSSPRRPALCFNQSIPLCLLASWPSHRLLCHWKSWFFSEAFFSDANSHEQVLRWVGPALGLGFPICTRGEDPCPLRPLCSKHPPPPAQRAPRQPVTVRSATTTSFLGPQTRQEDEAAGMTDPGSPRLPL